MAKLYELVGEYRYLYDLNLDDDTLRDTLDSIDWTERLNEKVEGYAQVIETKLAEAKMFEEAEKKFKAKKEAAKKSAAWLQGNIFDAMKLTNQTEIKSGIFTVQIRKNPESVKVDENLLPKKYFVKKVTTAPDKKTIKGLLKAGKRVRGAELIRTEKLVIK
ncbi:siphovirus Gp157 family protein [Streptococcus sp. H49]|uniref:siphovirus Gp157 family protein n=1 Tax=Streptococcus huangxiaojuni TaxID=3237239 RepID=UPI0034A50656